MIGMEMVGMEIVGTEVANTGTIDIAMIATDVTAMIEAMPISAGMVTTSGSPITGAIATLIAIARITSLINLAATAFPEIQTLIGTMIEATPLTSGGTISLTGTSPITIRTAIRANAVAIVQTTKAAQIGQTVTMATALKVAVPHRHRIVHEPGYKPRSLFRFRNIVRSPV